MAIKQYNKRIGANVREARLAAGMTQVVFAKRAKTTQSTLSGYESGRRALSIATLLRFAKALKMPASDLLKEL